MGMKKDLFVEFKFFFKTNIYSKTYYLEYRYKMEKYGSSEKRWEQWKRQHRTFEYWGCAGDAQ